MTQWGAEHTCIAADTNEVDRLITYLDQHSIDRTRLTVRIGSSHAILPTLVDQGEFDLVLIDGCHGWPMAIVDWFYTARRLRVGGVVVLDDIDLRSVNMGLKQYLRRDPRWSRLERKPTWVAYRKTASCDDDPEEWTEQPFLRLPARVRMPAVVPRWARPLVKKAASVLRGA